MGCLYRKGVATQVALTVSQKSPVFDSGDSFLTLFWGVGRDPSETPPGDSFFRNPQMWERAHVRFGGTGRKRKGPCTKQCAWRKHGSSDTRLAEACPPKLRNTVKYRVEEMRPKWPFWKHRAPKMRMVEAQCAHWKHCYPEIPLGSHPTSRVSQFFDFSSRGSF